MAHITPRDLQELGFDQSQFGDPDNWAGAGGFLAKIIDEKAAFVRDKVGAGLYDAPDSLQKKILAAAEKYYAESELWRRRVVQLASNHAIARNPGEPSAMDSFEKRSQSAERRANEALTALPAEKTPGGAFGHVVTTHFGT